MIEPPVIAFGPAETGGTWWAVLPSDRVLRSDRLTDLLATVERTMATDHPGRPFALQLDPTGMWDPGDAT
ncbi:hypothetical protein [Pseudofrankia asymbiotica]|uniref:Uncharacterized protein n=1 Tax=Pseudofrankia asymbiotica TaxID=1834516 RepID=A0A1V2I9T9_9ACTN|nr:hypothetical protein [Pseudofrankia asymbiotica]ONH29121.1 hypothetical protein BL253_17015 [Pseudofrankia asymbiotica]